MDLFLKNLTDYEKDQCVDKSQEVIDWVEC